MQTVLLLAITALFFIALWVVVKIARRLIAKGKGKCRARKEYRGVTHRSIDERSELNITKKQQ